MLPRAWVRGERERAIGLGNVWVVGCDESNFIDLGRTEAKFKYVEERTGDVGVKTMNPNKSSEKLCSKGW